MKTKSGFLHSTLLDACYILLIFFISAPQGVLAGQPTSLSESEIQALDKVPYSHLPHSLLISAHLFKILLWDHDLYCKFISYLFL